MRFDKTFIAIRERSSLELLDLTIHVIRYHFRAIATLAAIGILPWLLIDGLLTWWMVSRDFYQDYVMYFYVSMGLLVISQAQIGTTFVTHYLGQAMFVGRPGIMASFFSVFKSNRGKRKGKFSIPFFFLWIHLVIRLVLPVVLIAMMLTPETRGHDVTSVLVLISFFIAAGLLIRSARPFVSEMLLLERTPRRSTNPNEIDFRTRSKSLHSSASSDSVIRLMLAFVISISMTFTFYSAFCLFDKVLHLQGNAMQDMNFIYWPIALWLTATVVAVFRFLAYIDTRIRLEGWAVELRMRAEALNLSGRDQHLDFGQRNVGAGVQRTAL
jgi:hypothetical protein